MILNELTLRRFRSHENLTLQFHEGVTGIVGKNGSGKSSVIEAIGFLFTGEADDDKNQVITSGSNGNAFVRGRFTLDGKVGTIERALDTSKVLLEYDGHKYHKAGEVKELWARLLQIDNHIFKHVIMAKQKCIPELFTGDSSVREKAFQRIFMVPNTERVRNVIWDHYLKPCPPALPEDDLAAIENQKALNETVLKPKREAKSILSNSLLSDAQMSAAVNYTSFYNKCMQDAARRPGLLAEEERLKEAAVKAEAAINDIATELRLVPDNLEACYDDLVRSKERFVLRERQLAHAATTRAELESLRTANPTLDADVAEANQRMSQYSSELAVAKARIEAVLEELAVVQSLSGVKTCPTCHQEIKDIGAHLHTLETQHTVGQTQASAAQTQVNRCQVELHDKGALLNRIKNLESQLEHVEKELRDLGDVKFDQTELDSVSARRDRMRHLLKIMRPLYDEHVNMTASLRVVRQQINGLVIHEGAATPAEELAIMNQVLHTHRERVAEISQLEREIMQLEAEQRVLDQRRKTSIINAAKNSRRNEYVNLLKQAYDMLHTSQFPRKLIQTYSEVVEEELQLQLQKFAIPYRTTIDDEFRIVVANAAGHIVPRLSGGQEMVVGFCLRLALHSMFSQSFPMLIIDEGTTHLDTENEQLYFKAIETLKKDKTIQQLIIIDHSAALADVVDNVIRL